MKHIFITLLLSGIFLVNVAVGAQTKEAAPPCYQPAGSTDPSPLIDPVKELKGKELVEMLRQGGYVLFMRHAQNVPGTEQCSQKHLTNTGEEQARKVGATIRVLRIPIGEVRSSPLCRARDTARLLGLGAIEITEDLNQACKIPGFDVHNARFKHLVELPVKGTNYLLVSHVNTSARREERIINRLAIAEIAVYKPDGTGGTEPVARIPVEEWDNLIKAATIDGNRIAH